MIPTSLWDNSICSGVDCTFDSLIQFGNHVVLFLIYLAIPLAVIAFAYAGFLIMTAGGDEGKVKKGREIFTKVVIGFALILTAWLIVYTITNALLDDDKYILLDKTTVN